MTVRQYWVHYDEPMHPEPPPAAPSTTPETPPANLMKEWEAILNALLDLIEPHPALYRSALHLLSGRTGPLPPLPT